MEHISGTQKCRIESCSGPYFMCDLGFSAAQLLYVSWGHCFSSIIRSLERHLWRPFHPILKQVFKTEEINQQRKWLPLSIVLEGIGRSNLDWLPNL